MKSNQDALLRSLASLPKIEYLVICSYEDEDQITLLLSKMDNNEVIIILNDSAKTQIRPNLIEINDSMIRVFRKKVASLSDFNKKI